VIISYGIAGAFDKAPVWHAAGASGLATPALHTGIERLEHFVGERRIVVVDLAHQRDPPARRQEFVPGYSKRWTMRQA